MAGRLEDACTGTGGGGTADLSGEAGFSTSLLVYGSHVVTVEETPEPTTSAAVWSILSTLARGASVPQACVAALAAAGGLVRSVEAILLELDLSLPPDLNVRNIPPFFSGLGVLESLLLEVVVCGPTGTGGGDRVEANVAELCCKGDLFTLIVSCPELSLVVYDGLLGTCLGGSVGGLAMAS